MNKDEQEIVDQVSDAMHGVLKWFVKENTHLSRDHMDYGWGNGYVCIPKHHPCYGMNYNDIHDKYEIGVHGGLTFSSLCRDGKFPECPPGDYWIVGFDTAHSGDTLSTWSKQAVEWHTESLMKQFAAIK